LFRRWWNNVKKVNYPQDTRFAKSVLVMAPGLTVKSRLAVLLLSAAVNYYEEFNIVPFTFLPHEGGRTGPRAGRQALQADKEIAH